MDRDFVNVPIINVNGDLTDYFLKTVKTNQNLQKVGRDYNVISIIGCQSTGKSTLLNKLFGTDFATLNLSVGRQQTTKGILMSKSADRNIFILDIEGSDSAAKWDNRSPFENSTALFALVMSQVLIINMFTQDVGKYVASNYGVLKVVFENNIKLFKQESKKQLIFTLRDFSDDENFESLRAILVSDINKIWAEIIKPREYVNSTPDQFFDITILSLHHYKYNNDKFLQDVVSLRERFVDANSSYYLFRNYDYSYNIPLDGLYLYMEKIWGTIKSDKDINLPSQKTMVATLRCTDIRNEILQAAGPRVQQLKNNVKVQPYEKFSEESTKILNDTLAQYDESTANYDKIVAEERKKELIDNLLSVLTEIFFEQATLIKKTIQLELTQKLSAIKFDTSNIDALKDKLKKVKQEIEIRLDQLIQMTKSDYLDTKISLFYNETKEIINSQLQAYREKQLNLVVKKLFMNQKRKMEGTVGSLFNDLDKNFWAVVNDAYGSRLKELEDLLKFNLADVFELDSRSIETQVENVRDDFRRELESILRDKFQELPYYILKKFKAIFGRGDNGLPVTWKNLKVEDIDKKYVETKKSVEEIINAIRVFDTKTGSTELDREAIISEKALENSLNKIIEDFKGEYEEAIRKNKASELNNIPRWLWIVLIYFMYDDVWDMIRTPLLFYPVMLIVGFIVFCVTTGHADIPLQLSGNLWTVVKMLLGPKLKQLGINI